MTRIELIQDLLVTKKSLDLKSNDFKINIISKKGNILNFKATSLLYSIFSTRKYTNEIIIYLLECYKIITKIQDRYQDIQKLRDLYKSKYSYDYLDLEIDFNKKYNLNDLKELYKSLDTFYFDLDFELLFF